MTDEMQPPSADAELADDAEINLLSSPIERTAVNRLFVIGGPLALLATIVASLWVSWAHVPLYAVVQTDTEWVLGSTRAVRVMITSERGYDPGRVPVDVELSQGELRTALGSLPSVGVGLAQGTLSVPETFAEGPALLHVHAATEPEPVSETVEVVVAATPTPREPKHIISSVPAQYSNDTEAQPPNVKIDLRPYGRVQTGFINQFYVRISDPEGRPWQGPVEVEMIKGELDDHVATPDRTVTVVRGNTDRLGLLSWSGLLVSEIVRLDVRVMSRSAPNDEIASRAIMLISFPGVVSVSTDEAVADAAQELELSVIGLSGKRVVYVDVHDPSGAWIETLPPVKGRELPRPWPVPNVGDGIVQLEAYDQLTTPGESTSVARLQVARSAETLISLQPLIEAQKAGLSLPRTDESFDADREGAWLSAVGAMDLSPAEIETFRRWLIGTLPVSVYGPQAALSTRQRDDEALAAFKRRWTLVFRWVLLGGGGLFLVAMTVVMARSHGAAAEKTRAFLRQMDGTADRDLAVEHVDRAQRTAMVRGLGLVAVMAGALILAVLMLEAMVWQF